ncbi:MAG TPA: hypothetical protein VF306_18725 [Pirellulales bacterium]
MSPLGNDKALERRPIQIQWDGPRVLFTPEDQDRFVTEAQWAVNACQNALAAERFWEQFTSEFLTTIHIWCEEHADHVAACYVPFPVQSLEVFVISRSERYDFSLSDAVTSLEFELYKKRWPSDVKQIPSGTISDLETFFDPASSIQIYGDLR